MNEEHLVEVVIPVYKPELTDLEQRSMEQAVEILRKYPITVVKPESLDLSLLLQQYPAVRTESFDDSFFDGIASYNRLMLSSGFYKRFLRSRYILIYQLDAFVFRDELSEWCDKGYDYIAAPWLKKPVYSYPVISQIMNYYKKKAEKKGLPSKQHLYNKVGNGGFSLRKVKSHLEAVDKYSDRIHYYLSQELHHLYYEDVFWATEVSEFRYPEAMEAVHFSFDKYPALCFKLTKGKLPFGCHGWYKRKMKNFWKPIIGF